MQEERRHVLAIDLGTSGCKCAAVSLSGRVASWAFEPVATETVGPDGAEQSPEEWWRALLGAVGVRAAAFPTLECRLVVRLGFLGVVSRVFVVPGVQPWFDRGDFILSIQACPRFNRRAAHGRINESNRYAKFPVQMPAEEVSCRRESADCFPAAHFPAAGALVLWGHRVLGCNREDSQPREVSCGNLCFGGPKRNRLFMAGSQSLYAVYTQTQGAAPG